MIFVTVGGNTPFDRLVKAVDDWSAAHPDVEVRAQIGPGGYKPEHMSWSKFLDPADFQQTVRAADLMVSHAGMGAILSALDAGVPLLVLPRQAARNETRNDHQIATVGHLQKRGLFHLAADESELREMLDRWEDLSAFQEPISDAPLVSLQTAIVEFIERH